MSTATETFENCTTAKFEELCAVFEFRCAYCNKLQSEVGGLVKDHLIPRAKGGTDSIDNIVPACTHCNSSKGNRTADEYFTFLRRRHIGAILASNIYKCLQCGKIGRAHNQSALYREQLCPDCLAQKRGYSTGARYEEVRAHAIYAI